MAQARLIKSRIKSATNIAKITKAMEMVAASKMRRAQEQALSSRPYTHKLVEMLHTIASFTDSSMHPLLSEAKNLNAPALVVLVSTDKGLAGALNANLFRATLELMLQFKKPHIVAIGKRAKDFALKSGIPMAAQFEGMPDRLTLNDILPITEVFVDGFLKGEFSSIHSVHMQFVSTLTQKPESHQILPVAVTEMDKPVRQAQGKQEYIFEPNPNEILSLLLRYYIENGFFQTMLEAKASEHSARMVSMKNASDNAKDIVGSLKLEYNKSRQAGITSELLDITTASLALN
ncbi:MAG TPA: ATP synthase F1 subunit gamma [Patescibacteria group bacterium]|nr:ATP synthase F1 subunit gamma [Patescibacteria group bacterium]